MNSAGKWLLWIMQGRLFLRVCRSTVARLCLKRCKFQSMEHLLILLPHPANLIWRKSLDSNTHRQTHSYTTQDSITLLQIFPPATVSRFQPHVMSQSFTIPVMNAYSTYTQPSNEHYSQTARLRACVYGDTLVLLCECVFLVCGVISSLPAPESLWGEQRTLKESFLKLQLDSSKQEQSPKSSA